MALNNLLWLMCHETQRYYNYSSFLLTVGGKHAAFDCREKTTSLFLPASAYSADFS